RPRVTRPRVTGSGMTTRPGMPRACVTWPSVSRPGPFSRGPGRLARPGQHRSAPASALLVRLARRARGEDLVGPLALVGQSGGGQPSPGQAGRGQFGVLGPACPAVGGRLLVL